VVGPAPGDSLEAAETRESSARDIGEAMAANGGLWKLRKGGIANDVVLRGFQSKDLNVLIDGQRIYGACPNHMDPPAFHADFSEVDRIEIGKGPFDVRNQGSLGGVINIVTQQPEPGWHASGNLSDGSFGFVNPSATASYGSGRFSALGGYSYRRSQPHVDGTGKRFTQYANFRTDAVESDAFRVGTFWGKFTAVPAKNHLAQVSYARQQADHVLYPYLQMDAIYDDADRVNVAYRIDGLSGLVDSLRFQGYFTRVNHWMTDQYRVSSAGMAREYSMGTMAQTKTFGGRAESGMRSITLGVETFRRQWTATTMMAGMAYKPQYSIPDVETDSIGIYAEYQKPLSDQLKLDLGGRFDLARSAADPSKANTDLYYSYNSTRLVSANDTLSSGSARVSYVSRNGLELSGVVGHASRLPEPQERFLALRRSGSDWVGNPTLSPGRHLSVSGDLSFVRGSQESGRYLPEIPPLTSRAGIRYDTGRVFAEVEGVFVAAQRRVDVELREEPTPGYGVANLRLGADYRRLSIRGGVNNLLNRAYYEHLSYQRDPFRTGTRVFEAGRNFFINLACRF
jgi:iron complex outermembrane receptor protein